MAATTTRTATLVHKGHGIYLDPVAGTFHHRPVIAGRRTKRRLQSTTLTMARKEIAALKTRQLESRLGLALDPYAALVTIGQLAGAWLDIQCPTRHGVARSGPVLAAETARLKRLLPFWRDKEARGINAEDCRDYHAWRVRRNRKPFRLGRSVDAELTTLSNLLTWAAQNTRKTGLNANPLAVNRPRFDRPDLVRHCTAVMPMTDEIFHTYAARLLASDRSRALGWQMLLEGLTGARTSELLACRVDSTEPRQPGYQDEKALHLHRLKKGIEPWALLEAAPGHSPLAECLAAFRAWHSERYPHSPWFIPGRDPKHPMTRTALRSALAKLAVELKLPKITSHGLRAYFVRVLRSLGVDDREITKRLGQRYDSTLVERTYGITEPGWFGSRNLDFLPADFPPAWRQWSAVKAPASPRKKNTNSIPAAIKKVLPKRAKVMGQAL